MKDHNCRQLFLEALSRHRSGDFTGSMNYLCRGIEYLLDKRIDPIAMRLRKQLALANIDVMVLRTEQGFRVKSNKLLYAESESAECLLLTVSMYKALVWPSHNDTLGSVSLFRTQFPRTSFVEIIALKLRSISRAYLNSELQLNQKRWRLALLVDLRFRLQRCLPIGNEYIAEFAKALGNILHEPNDIMIDLIKKHEYFFEFNFAKQTLHLSHKNINHQYLQQFIWPEMNFYQRIVAGNHGSRILVTIHMGDYIGAFNRISELSDGKRRSISLMQGSSLSGVSALSKLTNSNRQTSVYGQLSSLEIVSVLRKGGTTLAVLFDLHEDFGETVDVEFFGYRARFVKGPAMLAIMGRAPIYPFVTYERDGKNCIEMEQPIDPRLSVDESLEEGLTRITQKLVSLAEKWIIQNPDQWKYLLSIFSYFDRSYKPDGDIR